MSWDDSDRKSRLPKNWPQLVAMTKKAAGGRCQWRLKSGKRCPRIGTDCDHKRPGDDHSPSNLQWLCPHHHGKKSSLEGRQARQAKQALRRRPPEAHPGRTR